MRFATRRWVVVTALAVLIAPPSQLSFAQDAPAPEAVIAESEPNNTTGTADVISIGDVATGSIGSETDVDVYRFAATAGMHIFAQVQLVTMVDSTLELIGTNGTTVLKFDDNIDSNNFGSQLSYIIPASGFYYLRVDGPGTNGGTYALSLQLSSNGSFQVEVEPNDDPSAPDPITPGVPLRGSISPSSDADYFSFNLTSGARFYGYVQTDGSTLGNDATGESADLNLLNSGGISIEYDDDAGPGLSPLIAGAQTGATGTVRLVVSDPLQKAGVNPYVLHTAIFTTFIAETEPNNTPATADGSSGINVGAINSGGDVDYYAFNAPLGSSVFIALDNDPEGDAAIDPLDSRITLYGPDGGTALIVANASGNGPDGDEVIVFSPTVGGIHYVAVEDVNGAGGAAYTYHLGIQVTPGVQVTSNETIGLYLPAPSAWQLRNSNTPGPADLQFLYGPAGAGWRPVTGDWNGDGVDTLGLYNPTQSTFFLRNSNTTGVADNQFAYGNPGAGWLPIAGDWDGDGDDTIGLYSPSNGAFFLRNTNNAGVANIQFIYGPVGMGWLPIAGDWDGDGDDTIGLYDPVASVFYLRNSNSAGFADLQFNYGPPGSGWLPIAGDYDGDGIHTIGLYDPVQSSFYLRNSNTAGVADVQVQYGTGGVPVIGDWDGL